MKKETRISPIVRVVRAMLHTGISIRSITRDANDVIVITINNKQDAKLAEDSLAEAGLANMATIRLQDGLVG